MLVAVPVPRETHQVASLAGVARATWQRQVRRMMCQRPCANGVAPDALPVVDRDIRRRGCACHARDIAGRRRHIDGGGGGDVGGGGKGQFPR